MSKKHDTLKLHEEIPKEIKRIDTKSESAKTKAEEAYSKAEQAFQSASNGKQKIATAITGKGVPATGDETFDSLSAKIDKIQTGEEIAKIDHDPSLDVILKNGLITDSTRLITCDVETGDYIFGSDNKIYWMDSNRDVVLLHNNFTTYPNRVYLDMQKKIFIAQGGTRRNSVLFVDLDTITTKVHGGNYGSTYYVEPGELVVYNEDEGAGSRGTHVYNIRTGEKLFFLDWNSEKHSFSQYRYCKAIDKYYRAFYENKGFFEVYDKNMKTIHSREINPSSNFSMLLHGDTLVNLEYPSEPNSTKPPIMYTSSRSVFVINLHNYTQDSTATIPMCYNRNTLAFYNKYSIYNSIENEYLSDIGYIRYKTDLSKPYLCNIDSTINPISIDQFYRWAIFKDGNYIKNDKTFNIAFNTKQSDYIVFYNSEVGSMKIEVLKKTGFDR